MRRVRRRLGACVMLAASGGLASSAPAGSIPSARAATGAAVVAALNAERALNGLPSGLIEDPALSADCAAHDGYMAANHVLTHVEVPGNPGYSQGGAYAGENAVLNQGVGWDAGNPYLDAPLHRDQLLAPRLLKLGSADAEGYSCTTTFPGWTRPAPAATTVYSVPGPGATAPPSQLARERPFTPGQLAGIPAGQRTGPYLFVLADAPGQSPVDNPATLGDATLTGPAGPVAVRTVDGAAALPDGTSRLAAYMSPGGFIIPVLPLRANTVYQAHVVVGFGGVQTSHDWSFTTTGNDPDSRLTAGAGRLRFRSRSPAHARVTFIRATGAHAPAVSLAPGHVAPLRLAPGTWQACATQRAHGSFAGFSRCLTLIVTGAPLLRLGAGRPAGGILRLPLRIGAVLRGRAAALRLTPLTVRCARSHCHTVAGRATTRTITLAGTALSLSLPQPGHGVRVTLETAAFQLVDAPWTSASTTSTYVRP